MIRLLPDEDESALIKCELLNYNFSQPGEEHLYEALSYVWGSPVRSRSIILDGYMLPVTESLYTALLHLRSKQLERILWIDAMSINQNDDSEKSKQIPLMRMIYAQARRVVVWLGEAHDYGERALETTIACLGRKKVSEPVQGRVRVECEKLLQRDWFRRTGIFEIGLRPTHLLFALLPHFYKSSALAVSWMFRMLQGRSNLISPRQNNFISTPGC